MLLTDLRTERHGHGNLPCVPTRSTAVLISFAICCVASCSRPEQKPHIALITPLTTSDLWKGMHAGAYKASKEGGTQLYWNGPTEETDATRQVTLIERQIRRHASGIVLAPTHASVPISAIAAAQRQHIPVVLAGTDLAICMGAGVGIVKSDDAATGRIAADYMATLLPQGGGVAVIGIDDGNSASLARVSSFEAALQQYKDLHFVEKNYVGADPFASDDDPVRLFGRHPKIAAVFAPTVNAARYAHAALEEKHLLGRVFLIVCDQDADAIEQMKRNEVQAIVAQDVFQIGFLSVQDLLSSVHHGAPLGLRTLAPMLITKSNLYEPRIQHFLRPYKGFDR